MKLVFQYRRQMGASARAGFVRAGLFELVCSSWISFNQPGDPPRIDGGHNSQLKMRAGGISPLPLSVRNSPKNNIPVIVA
jgi:hypothetical protein